MKVKSPAVNSMKKIPGRANQIIGEHQNQSPIVAVLLSILKPKFKSVHLGFESYTDLLLPNQSLHQKQLASFIPSVIGPNLNNLRTRRPLQHIHWDIKLRIVTETENVNIISEGCWIWWESERGTGYICKPRDYGRRRLQFRWANGPKPLWRLFDFDPWTAVNVLTRLVFLLNFLFFFWKKCFLFYFN